MLPHRTTLGQLAGRVNDRAGASGPEMALRLWVVATWKSRGVSGCEISAWRGPQIFILWPNRHVPFVLVILLPLDEVSVECGHHLIHPMVIPVLRTGEVSFEFQGVVASIPSDYPFTMCHFAQVREGFRRLLSV